MIEIKKIHDSGPDSVINIKFSQEAKSFFSLENERTTAALSIFFFSGFKSISGLVIMLSGESMKETLNLASRTSSSLIRKTCSAIIQDFTSEANERKSFGLSQKVLLLFLCDRRLTRH